MNRVLVAYATGSGCTEGIADHIGDVFAQCGARVDVLPINQVNHPSDYDAMVLGSGVRMGQWHRSAVEWLITHANIIRARPTAVFSVCLTPVKHPERAETVRGWIHPILAEVGVEPLNHGVFAGWASPEHFNLFENILLWAHGDRGKDKRDWDAVAAWAQIVAGEMGFMGPVCHLAERPGQG